MMSVGARQVGARVQEQMGHALRLASPLQRLDMIGGKA